MEMSFFPEGPQKDSVAGPDKSGHQPPFGIIVKSALRTCPDLRGTLRLLVTGPSGEKDLSMLFSRFSILLALR
jgi:hypothetical protein